ncbi:MAG: pilus assembly protein TadB, partial [Terrabacter sp.]|nr:pilus assembly protein TadB [Terrabacter sp.]
MNGVAERVANVLRDGWSWTGAAAGVLLLAGVALVVAGLPASRRPTLDDRLEPYLRDTPRPSSL